MIKATFSYFALPGQDWCITLRGCWPELPYWLISREFRTYTHRAYT